jgi:hypothetical protein
VTIDAGRSELSLNKTPGNRIRSSNERGMPLYLKRADRDGLVSSLSLPSCAGTASMPMRRALSRKGDIHAPRSATVGFGSAPYGLTQKSGPTQYSASGLHPTVGADDASDKFVEIHQTGAGTSTTPPNLTAGVGQATASGVVAPTFTSMSTGANPTVAVGLGYVVEVHQAGINAGTIAYRRGTISGTTITWGAVTTRATTGKNPAIARCGANFVEVHQTSDAASTLEMRTGKPTTSAGPLTSRAFAFAQ